MKKLYSKKLGGEAFALDAAQLDTLKKAGYTVPSPEEVIADAAAVKIEPPEGKRAYVVFDFKTGAFKVRTRTQTLAESEVGGFVGEVVSAAILCGFVERADMDKPKADAPATPTTASPLVNMLRDAFLRAANNNRMIRRQFPKGTDFDKVTAAEVKRVEMWLNNYPREILGFMSSAQAFELAFDRAA